MTGTFPHLFTGDERDFVATESNPRKGLDYMHARYYAFNLGRFMSVDPVGGEVGSSQSWNRYAYVRGNPTRYYDTDGRQVAEGVAAAAAADPPGAAVVAAAVALDRASPPQWRTSTYVVIGLSIYLKAVRDLRGHLLNLLSRSEGNQEQSEAEEEHHENTNPYAGPVTEDVIVVDSKGNAIPVKEGESVTSSPDGEYQQVRDKDGNPTGVRKDGAHKTHKKEPHAHRPDVDVEDNENLPIRQ